MYETREEPTDVAGRLHRVGRWVADGVIEVVTAESTWLLDLSHRRFQRCRPDANLGRALRFGRWSAFTRVDLEDDRLVVERARRPTVRAQIAAP